MQSLIAHILLKIFISLVALLLGSTITLAASPVKPVFQNRTNQDQATFPNLQTFGSIVMVEKSGYFDEAIPSNAIPSNAIPSNAIPSNAIPSNAIPSNAIPSNALPSNAIPSNGIPSNRLVSKYMRTGSIEIGSAYSAPSFGELVCLQSQGCGENTIYEGFHNPYQEAGSEMVAAPISDGTVYPVITQETPITEIIITTTITPTFFVTITVLPPVQENEMQTEVILTVTQNTNCRSGPGTVYQATTTINANQQVRATARHPATNYFVVENPNSNGECWLWGESVIVSGPVESLPIANPPPPPVTPTFTPTITRTSTPTLTPTLHISYVEIEIANVNAIGGMPFCNVYYRKSGASWSSDLLSGCVLPGQTNSFTVPEGSYDLRVDFCFEGSCSEKIISTFFSNGAYFGMKYP
ncbi:MAG: hypothetical protein C0410_12605 [Anaerolinea sp.]|nr:hypothetical protein [Anaerolinea sp.]